MNRNRSRPHHGRRLAAVLLSAGFVLAGCALVTAATPPTIVLSDGKPRPLQLDEMVVSPAGLDQWRKQLGDGKNRLVARCSIDTGLCTTVVIPLGGGGTPVGQLPRCPRGEKPVQDAEGVLRCPSDLLFTITIAQ